MNERYTVDRAGASGIVSGIDDRSILAVGIGALKDLWSKVLALIESDERQAAEIEALKARVSELEAAAGTASTGQLTVPDGPSASNGTPDADTVSTTALTESSEPADAPAQGGGREASAGASEGGSDTGEPAESTMSEAPSAALPGTSEPALKLEASNDNQPSGELPATGTE